MSDDLYSSGFKPTVLFMWSKRKRKIRVRTPPKITKVYDVVVFVSIYDAIKYVMLLKMLSNIEFKEYILVAIVLDTKLLKYLLIKVLYGPFTIA